MILWSSFSFVDKLKNMNWWLLGSFSDKSVPRQLNDLKPFGNSKVLKQAPLALTSIVRSAWLESSGLWHQPINCASRYHSSDPIRYSQFPRFHSRFLKWDYPTDCWQEPFNFLILLTRSIFTRLYAYKAFYDYLDALINIHFIRHLGGLSLRLGVLHLVHGALDDDLGGAGGLCHHPVNVGAVLLIVGENDLRKYINMCCFFCLL